MQILPQFKTLRHEKCLEIPVQWVELGGQNGCPGSRGLLHMIDFHRVRNIEKVLHVHLDAEPSLRQRGMDYMRAHLHEHQPG